MPFSVASVRCSFVGFNVNPKQGDQVVVAAGVVTVTSLTGDTTTVSTNQTMGTPSPTSPPSQPAPPSPRQQQQMSQQANNANDLYNQALSTAPTQSQQAIQAEQQQVFNQLQKDTVKPTRAATSQGYHPVEEQYFNPQIWPVSQPI